MWNHWGMLPICENTTRQVNAAWITRYWVLCSKTYNTLHSCAGLQQAARIARICETSLFCFRGPIVIRCCVGPTAWASRSLKFKLWDHKKYSYSSPSRTSYGVPIVSIRRKWPCYNETLLYCIKVPVWSHCGRRVVVFRLARHHFIPVYIDQICRSGGRTNPESLPYRVCLWFSTANRSEVWNNVWRLYNGILQGEL